MATANESDQFNSQFNLKNDSKLSEQSDILCSAGLHISGLNEDVGEQKVSALRCTLEKDLVAADLKWSLFVAACNTYRYDTCLRPFPPMYIKNENKDIDALVSTDKN